MQDTLPQGYSELKKQFDNYIELKKLKRTPERFIVLKEVCKNDRPFFADDIVHALQRSSVMISRATVYAVIDLLVKSGLLLRLPHRHGSRFLLAARCRDHALVICRKCDKITLYRQINRLRKLSELKVTKMYDTQPQIIVYGVCTMCNKADVQKNITK